MIRSGVLGAALVAAMGTAALAYDEGEAPQEVLVRAEEPLAQHGLYINPASLIFGALSVGYEGAISSHVTLQVGVQASYASAGNVSGKAVGLSLAPHYYFSDRAPSGAYLAPFVTAAYGWSSGLEASASGFGWAAGATVGWSWLLGAANIKLGLGVQYVDIFVSASDGQTSASLGIQGIAPAVDLSLGFVF